jgi:predicted transcriptional regulator
VKNQEIEKLRSDLEAAKQKLEAQETQICNLEAEASKLREASAEQKAFAVDFPKVEKVEAGGLLNQLKGRRKKSKADLADVELLLDLFCDGCDR